MSTAIEHRIDPRERPVGTGWVRRLLPYRTRRMVGPFIYADVIGPETLDAGLGINVDAHPHIGLSTMTYLFDGRLVHRDSTGAVQTIEPGAVNWMTAGSGVTHTERSHPDDLSSPSTMFGLQTWVALPSEGEELEPSFQHTAATAVPTEAIGKSSVRVAAGSGWGLESPVTGSSPLVLAELTLDPGGAVPVEVDLPELAVIALKGDLRINEEPVKAGQIAVLSPNTKANLVGTGTAIVLGGEPVGHRTIWWNFVHSDPDRIEHAKDEWANQRFPRVPNDHDPYVPLPTS
ncbi:MAG: pirin family protein [Microthrixaceae bacterium]|nr:pirin family protein [Microthrixaceae bacterium]